LEEQIMPRVPQTKSERVIKPETLDRKHAETHQQIERLPKAITRTFTNTPTPGVSKPKKNVNARVFGKIDAGLQNY
jgi:hypothetical protein